MRENSAVKMTNFTNFKQVDAQVEQHKRNMTCLNRNQKALISAIEFASNSEFLVRMVT